MEMAVEDTMEEEQMEMRTKNSWRNVKVVVVVKAVEETMMEKEPMRTKKIWRKTILEPDDDESGVNQMLL